MNSTVSEARFAALDAQWGNNRRVALERQHQSYSLSKPGRAFAARRTSPCQLCDHGIQRGDTVRPVGFNLYVHWQCAAEYVPPAKPRAITQAARRLSERTELRRQVFWAVTCPECGAKPGAGCQTEFGARRLRNHIQRVLTYSRLKRMGRVKGDVTVRAALRALLPAPRAPRVELPVVSPWGESSSSAWGSPMRT